MSAPEKNDLSRLTIDSKARVGQSLRRKRRWPLWLALFLVLGGGAAGALYLSSLPEAALTTVALVHPAQPLTLLNASGYVVAERKSALASKTTGRLVWRGVEEGSVVKQGQVVARLENEDLLAALERAKADLDSRRRLREQAEADFPDAEANYSRMAQLVKKGVIARSEYDSALARRLRTRAALEASRHAALASEAAVKEAEVALEYTNIRAPFDAVVLTKNADIGDIITPLGAAANAKASVVSIADMGSLLVECDVSETNISKVKQGSACDIQLDSLPGEHFPGGAYMIVPTADRSKATVMVKVRFNTLDPRVLPEMSAKVAFLERPLAPRENVSKLCLAPGALRERNGESVAFTVQDGKAKAVRVKPVGPCGALREIEPGVLAAGDKVLLDPPAAVQDGRPVKVVER